MATAQQNNQPLYNSRIVHTYIQLVKKKYPSVKIQDLLKGAGMEPHEVYDQGHWFTQDQINRFHEQLVRLTGNKNIAREAGQYAASPETIGVMRQYILGLGTPANSFELIGKASAKLTRSCRYDSRMISSNKVEITVAPYEGIQEEPFQCENRKGFFDAITIGLINRMPQIEHPECMFRGGKVCRYIISWDRTYFTYFQLIRNYAFFFFLLLAFILTLFYPLKALIPLYLIFLIGVLGLSLIANEIKIENLSTVLSDLRKSSDQLLDQIDINYNTKLVNSEIGEIINRQSNLEDALNEVCKVLESRLDFDRGMIMVANEEKTRLKFCAGFGYEDAILGFLKKLYFHLDNPESKGIFVVSFKEQKPFLINDVNDIQGVLSERSLRFAKEMGAKSFICSPIVCDNQSIGILAVDNIKSKRLLVQSDIELLKGICHFIGVSIRHTQHLEAREQQLNSILKVLVSSIDARDPQTKGHSELVAEYSLAICSELNLSHDFKKAVRVAALLHDYGKIALPDSMLKKRDKLTEYEYEYVKHHAEKTREILSKINFEFPLKDVPEIAGAHHERFDGSGYPRGFSGDEIPLGARIIAVADYFEALTASRYYSDPMPPEQALKIMEEESGHLFDKRIVDAFLNYYKRRLKEENHRLQKASAG